MKLYNGTPGEIVWIFLGSEDTQIARIEAANGRQFKVRAFNSFRKVWYQSTKWIDKDEVINNHLERRAEYAKFPVMNGKQLPLI